MSRITHNFREEFGPRQKCKRGKVYPYFVKYSPLHIIDVHSPFFRLVCLFSDPKPRRRYHRQPGGVSKVILLCQLCKSPVKKLKKIRKKLSIETHSSKFTTPSYTYFNSNLFKSKHAQHDCLRFGWGNVLSPDGRGRHLHHLHAGGDTELGAEVLHPPSYHRAGQDGWGPAQQVGYHGPVQPQPGHGDVGPRSEQQSTWPVTLHYSRPSSHEGARVMVACWMVPRWLVLQLSSQPMSPPRTGGTGRRIRKASGPSSPDLTRFSSSPNMFCTVNCWPRPSTSRGQLSMPISQYTFYNLQMLFIIWRRV